MHKGLNYRDASQGGYFSYELKVDENAKNYLVVKYFSGDVGRTFTIYVDDAVLADVTLENVDPDNFYELYYEIPAEAVKGKEVVTIKFAADKTGFAGGIFDKISMVKEKSEEPATTDKKDDVIKETTASKTDDAKKDGGISPVVIVVIVLAVVAIAAVAVVVVMKKKGGKKTQNDEDDDV